MATQNATNSPFPLATAKGGLGLANPTAHGILVGNGASPVTPIVLATGQLLIGITGSDPVAANLVAGAGINIDDTSVPGQITITNSSTGLSWTDVTGTTQAVAVNNGYVADNASLVTFTLPGTAAFGSIVYITGKGAGGWKLEQPASVNVDFGDMGTTVGTGGSLASTDKGDCISLVCVTANTKWRVIASIGNITVV